MEIMRWFESFNDGLEDEDTRVYCIRMGVIEHVRVQIVPEDLADGWLTVEMEDEIGHYFSEEQVNGCSIDLLLVEWAY